MSDENIRTSDNEFEDGPLFQSTKERIAATNAGRRDFHLEGFHSKEPAVQKILGVSYADGDRANAPASLHLDSLEQRIEMLGTRLGHLHLALDPILGPAEPTPGRAANDLRSASPLVQRIAEIDDMIINLVNNVEDLLSRVEV